MRETRKGSHSIYELHVHIVWSTKHGFQVLKGEVQVRCRDLLRQTCDSLDIQIVKGVVSKDHIHLHISYAPKIRVSDIVKRLKRRSARILLEEFGELHKRYWGGHFWVIGYGAWSSGNITDEMIQQYLEHHKEGPNGNRTSFWKSFNTLECRVFNGHLAYTQMALANSSTYGLPIHSI